MAMLSRCNEHPQSLEYLLLTLSGKHVLTPGLIHPRHLKTLRICVIWVCAKYNSYRVFTIPPPCVYSLQIFKG